MLFGFQGTKEIVSDFIITTLAKRVVVGLGGLEPPTSRLSGVRSNRLSYKPSWLLILNELRYTRSSAFVVLLR